MSSLCIQNLKTLAQIEAEKSVTETFVREKEKWTNKGTDKQYVADSLIHITTCHYQALYKILGQVIPEKSLMEKSLHTHIHTNIVTEKGKTIYPLYTLYTGDITKLQVTGCNKFQRIYKYQIFPCKSLSCKV